jgi:Na+/citrate or Na+/malate symporter
MFTIISLAVFGAIIAAVVGTVWYSDKTPMGRLHMKYLGFDKLNEEEKKKNIEEAKPKMFKMYLAQMLLSFLTAFAVVLGTGILWSNCDRSIAWKKFFSDISSNLVTLLLTALLASLFI